MRIIFLIRALTIGGAERQLAVLADGIAKRGHHVVVATFYEDSDIKLTHAIHRPLFKKSRWDIKGFFNSLISLIHHEKPDIVHGYLTVSNVLVGVLKMIFPKVHMVMGIRASNMNWREYGTVPALLAWLEARLSKYADAIITNSKASLTYLKAKCFTKKNVICIENGIDTELFKPNLESRDFYRGTWGVPEDTHLIALVGRLDPMKGHSVFIMAAKALRDKNVKAKYMIMGNGPEDYRKSLEQNIQKHDLQNYFILLPGLNPVPYSAFDVLCSASLFGEGFPNVVAEAMSCSVPCVVTNIGDSAHVVGESGIVIEANNPQALTKGILEMLQIKKSIQPLCRPRIENEFSTTKLVSRTEEFLKELLNA